MRYSVKNITPDSDRFSNVVSVIEELVERRSESSRSGYPRAGGIDRLSILVLQASDPCHSGYFYQLTTNRIFVDSVRLNAIVDEIFIKEVEEKINGYVLPFYNVSKGEFKYGIRNHDYAVAESTIFCSFLHNVLCDKGIENRIHGGVRRETVSKYIHTSPSNRIENAVLF